MSEFEVGDKVTYVTPYKKEIGVVKSLSGEDHAFVVYSCNDDWENYKDYTGARTRLNDLLPGWRDGKSDKKTKYEVMNEK